MSQSMESCMDKHRGGCRGPVEYHATPGRLKGFPRCEAHWDDRMKRYELNERPLTGDVEPDWFDPADAGETW